MRFRIAIGSVAVAIALTAAGCGNNDSDAKQDGSQSVREVVEAVQTALIENQPEEACKYASEHLKQVLADSWEYNERPGKPSCENYVVDERRYGPPPGQTEPDGSPKPDAVGEWVGLLEKAGPDERVKVISVKGDRAHIQVPVESDADYYLVKTADGWKIDSGSNWPFDGSTGQ